MFRDGDPNKGMILVLKVAFGEHCPSFLREKFITGTQMGQHPQGFSFASVNGHF